MKYRIEDDIEIIAFEKRRGDAFPMRTIEIKSRPVGRFKNMRRYRVQISKDLIATAGIKATDKVHLGKVKGANIWVLVPTLFPDGFSIRHNGSWYIDNMDLAARLHVDSNADAFEAWVDDNRIYFRPKVENEKPVL